MTKKDESSLHCERVDDRTFKVISENAQGHRVESLVMVAPPGTPSPVQVERRITRPPGLFQRVFRHKIA